MERRRRIDPACRGEAHDQVIKMTGDMYNSEDTSSKNIPTDRRRSSPSPNPSLLVESLEGQRAGSINELEQIRALRAFLIKNTVFFSRDCLTHILVGIERGAGWSDKRPPLVLAWFDFESRLPLPPAASSFMCARRVKLILSILTLISTITKRKELRPTLPPTEVADHGLRSMRMTGCV